jgi:hypothetical protein
MTERLIFLTLRLIPVLAVIGPLFVLAVQSKEPRPLKILMATWFAVAGFATVAYLAGEMFMGTGLL